MDTDVSALERKVDALLREVRGLKVIANKESNEDGWLDAKAAARYMGISAGSFDKYRYNTTPRITGSPLDGKVLYKKSDLDAFIRLYAIKAAQG